jgi:hypothetical protein
MRNSVLCILTGCAILPWLLVGCQARTTTADTAISRTPGTISVPFRNRWWHFYERGLSWADGGDAVRAEADFRQCLRLRQTDSRLARTYGMHFVQCFAHRELGAILLRRGDLDASERELRLSLEQEPSAKAEHLLLQLQAQRAGVAAVQPEPQPDPDGNARQRIEIASVTPVAEAVGQLQISGRMSAAAGTVLWCTNGTEPAVRIASDPAGSFMARIAAGSSLLLGSEAGPDQTSVAALPVAASVAEAPSLSLDGPDGGAAVDGQAWYRWQAEASAGLESLQIADDTGLCLSQLPLTGVRAAGTLRLLIPAGRHALHFTISDRVGGSVRAMRQVDSRAGPLQDRSLRAVALAIPLQSPRPGAMRPGDDPRLLSALIEDGRFRFVDQRADGILARELALVEAGYVDRATAAAAGRRLSCRYVIAGTMARGERDAECFLRLVHCASGRVVASADAYAELGSSSDVDALLAAAAGRLRQVFPVVAGTVTREGGNTVRVALGAGSGAVALMRLHVFPESGTRAAGEVELVDIAGDSARGTVVSGEPPLIGHGVSE